MWIHSGRSSLMDRRRTHYPLHKNAFVSLDNRQGERIEQTRNFLVGCMYRASCTVNYPYYHHTRIHETPT